MSSSKMMSFLCQDDLSESATIEFPIHCEILYQNESKNGSTESNRIAYADKCAPTKTAIY